MKKQIKKLDLKKRTITNLETAEMNKLVGGGTNGNNCNTNPHGPPFTKRCNTF